MKTVGWSGLFLASFLAGHFAANPWLLPVGKILLFVKLYIAMLLAYILLTQIIPYIWQYISEWGSAFRRTAVLDHEHFGGGMQLSFASTGMMTAPEKHEQDVVSNKEIPSLTIVNAATMTESKPVELKPETKPVSEAEFLAAIRGLTLLPPAVVLPEEVLDTVVSEPTETGLTKASDEEFLAVIRGLVLLLDPRFLMEIRKLTLVPAGEMDMTAEISVLDVEPESSQSEFTAVVDEMEAVALVEETEVHLHIASEDLSWILAEDSSGIEIDFEASAEAAVTKVVESDLEDMENFAQEGFGISPFAVAVAGGTITEAENSAESIVDEVFEIIATEAEEIAAVEEIATEVESTVDVIEETPALEEWGLETCAVAAGTPENFEAVEEEFVFSDGEPELAAFMFGRLQQIPLVTIEETSINQSPADSKIQVHVPQRYTCKLRCRKPGALFRGPVLSFYCKFICRNGNY